MKDRAARNEEERNARRDLLAVVGKMLRGEESFLEGAAAVMRLRDRVGGISGHDPDFHVFAAIASETDHLPLAAVRHLWAEEALERLDPEIRRAEEWASGAGREACKNLLARFGQDR